MALTDQDPIADQPTKTCRTCDAPIKWARTEENDKPVPLDAKPISVFGVTGSRRNDSPVVRTRKAYLSHFATCPQAASHSKSSR